MDKTYPALEVRGADAEWLSAAVDGLSATAIEERDDSIRIFFSNAPAREVARSTLAPAFDVAAVDVPDEDWARRSQEGLQPISVGRITVSPTRSSPTQAFTIVITPSMGFGTGHHATTRLCLEALQALDLENASVLDIGCGSGVLAIAAERLGARCAVGIDDDADAVQAARENLALNPGVDHVTFEVGDLRTAALPMADVVTANLTGALLVQAAGTLLASIRTGGTLIVSGFLHHERDAVVAALDHRVHVVWERQEDGWVGMAVKKT